jgi:hypothetical protein
MVANGDVCGELRCCVTKKTVDVWYVCSSAEPAQGVNSCGAFAAFVLLVANENVPRTLRYCMKREWLTVSLLLMFKLHCVVGTSSKMFTESRSFMMQVLCTVSYASFGAMLCPFKRRYPWRTEILQYRCVVDVLYAFSYAALYVNLYVSLDMFKRTMLQIVQAET